MSTPAQLEAFRTADLTGCNESVYEAIATAPDGATIDEIIRDTDIGYRSVPCTVSRLRASGLVKDSGRMREGAVGKDQTIWVAGDDREVVRSHRIVKLRKLAESLGFDLVGRPAPVDQAAARVFGVG